MREDVSFLLILVLPRPLCIVCSGHWPLLGLADEAKLLLFQKPERLSLKSQDAEMEDERAGPTGNHRFPPALGSTTQQETHLSPCRRSLVQKGGWPSPSGLQCKACHG